MKPSRHTTVATLLSFTGLVLALSRAESPALVAAFAVLFGISSGATIFLLLIEGF